MLFRCQLVFLVFNTHTHTHTKQCLSSGIHLFFPSLSLCPPADNRHALATGRLDDDGFSVEWHAKPADVVVSSNVLAADHLERKSAPRVLDHLQTSAAVQMDRADDDGGSRTETSQQIDARKEEKNESSEFVGPSRPQHNVLPSPRSGSSECALRQNDFCRFPSLCNLSLSLSMSVAKPFASSPVCRRLE